MHISLKPVAKQSFRSTKNGHAYLPKQVVNFRKNFQSQLIKSIGNPAHVLYSGTPLEVYICFVFETKNKRLLNQPKITRPDVDNLAKAVLDGMKDIVFDDDSFVVSLSCFKRWGTESGIDIEFHEYAEQKHECRGIT